MKGKKRIKLQDVKRRIDTEGLRAALTRGEVTMLLRERIAHRDGLTLAQARNNVGMALDRARLDRTAEGKYTMDVIGFWVRTHYGDLFKDLPFNARCYGVEPPGIVRATMGWPVPPVTIEACHSYIDHLQAQFSLLQAEKNEIARKLKYVSRLKKCK